MLTVYLSAERADLPPAVNEERTARLRRALETLRLPYRRVLGQYKGVQEQSFAVDCGADDIGGADRDVAGVVALAAYLEQESVLVVDAERRAVLLPLEAESIDLGTWREVSADVAAQLEAWTFDPDTETYYAVG